jgi:glycosidase
VRRPVGEARLAGAGPALAPAVALALFFGASCSGSDGDGRREIATHVDDWRDEVIYMIVVDRFDNGDPGNDRQDGIGPDPRAAGPPDLARWQGGDWRGIRRRLDYLAGLGVTTLWISPIVAQVPRAERQDGYHGYWAADFTRLEPRFGDQDELEALVDDAHARGMKVILDVVVNHTGRVFAYDLDGDGAMDPDEIEPPFAARAPYAAPVVWLGPHPTLWRGEPTAKTPELLVLGADAFHRRGKIDDFSAPVMRELGDFPDGLRDLGTEDGEIAAALVDTWARWIAETDVDGLRLDAVPHAAPAFWTTFATGLRQRLAPLGKTKLLLAGEVWNADPAEQARYVGPGGLDSVFDFTFKWDVLDAFIYDGVAAADVMARYERARATLALSPQPGGVGLSPWQARIVFADNHDLPRLRAELDDPWAAELAMTLVFTVDAIPCIYYGTEQELDGNGGPRSRERLWDTGFSTQTRMYRHLGRLAALRRASSALRRGALVLRYASPVSARSEAPGAGLLAFERAHGDDRVLVVVNGHPRTSAGAAVPTGFAPGSRLVDGLGGRIEITVGEDGAVPVDVPAREAWILMPAPRRAEAAR